MMSNHILRGKRPYHQATAVVQAPQLHVPCHTGINPGANELQYQRWPDPACRLQSDCARRLQSLRLQTGTVGLQLSEGEQACLQIATANVKPKAISA
eukprot:4963078-Heterocapsa_arctica.AAC.1